MGEWFQIPHCLVEVNGLVCLGLLMCNEFDHSVKWSSTEKIREFSLRYASTKNVCKKNWLQILCHPHNRNKLPPIIYFFRYLPRVSIILYHAGNTCFKWKLGEYYITSNKNKREFVLKMYHIVVQNTQIKTLLTVKRHFKRDYEKGE